MTDREIILDSLMEILEKGQYSHLVLRSVLQKYDYLPKQQRSFIKRTCEGTIENKIYIDYVIDSFAKTKTPKMKPLIRTLLRMGTYQILFLDGKTCHKAWLWPAERLCQRYFADDSPE